MGQILLIKGADFSENAVSLDKVYDVVKYTDEGSGDYPMQTGSSAKNFNTIPAAKGFKIYAVAITLPNDISGLTKSAVTFRVGTCNSNRQEIENVVTYATDFIEKVVDGDIAGGTVNVLPLSSPVTVHVGDYVWFGISGQRWACYARTPSGDYGYIQNLNSETPTEYNLGVTFYGEEID